MNHTLIGVAKLVFVKSALQMLIVTDDDLSFLSAERSPLFSVESRLRVQIQATHLTLTLGLFVAQSTHDDVLEHG